MKTERKHIFRNMHTVNEYSLRKESIMENNFTCRYDNISIFNKIRNASSEKHFISNVVIDDTVYSLLFSAMVISDVKEAIKYLYLKELKDKGEDVIYKNYIKIQTELENTIKNTCELAGISTAAKFLSK